MNSFLIFAFFAIGAHMLDACRHYVRENETFSAILNLVFGLLAVLIGIVLWLRV